MYSDGVQRDGRAGSFFQPATGNANDALLMRSLNGNGEDIGRCAEQRSGCLHHGHE